MEVEDGRWEVGGGRVEGGPGARIESLKYKRTVSYMYMNEFRTYILKWVVRGSAGGPGGPGSLI